MRLRIVLPVVAVVTLLLAGAGVAYLLTVRDRPEGALDTELQGVDISSAVDLPPRPAPGPLPPEADRVCWPAFGGDPQRSLARPDQRLGIPARKALWARGMGAYMEYPPSYCDGVLYVTTFAGRVLAVGAEDGAIRWTWRAAGPIASTPAIAGDRIVVSSHDGTVTALRRADGSELWQVRTAGKVESSPVVVDGLVYFGSTDGRLFAVVVATGRVRWAYDTGGRINSSPSLFGRRVCITNYSGAVFCVRKDTGEKLWSTYVKRDAFRYESFYASPSTDGARLYTIARSGRVMALDASDGSVRWTRQQGGLGYSTPAVGSDRIFVGGFDGGLRAYRKTDGRELWRAQVGGRVLGAPVLIGNLVFFSTLETETYAARASDGKIVWHIGMGKYSPGIATERTYYFTLNGILVAFRGREAQSTTG